MLTEHYGDLIIEARAGHYDAIMHCCNCFNTLGKGTAHGIAKIIGEEWPVARLADNRTKIGDINKLGTFSDCVTANGLIIFNVYGQYGYGRGGPRADDVLAGIYRTWSEQLQFDAIACHVHYDSVRKAFKLINDTYPSMCIGMPAFGAGLAYGDLDIIRQIVKETLTDQDVHLVLFNE